LKFSIKNRTKFVDLDVNLNTLMYHQYLILILSIHSITSEVLCCFPIFINPATLQTRYTGWVLGLIKMLVKGLLSISNSIAVLADLCTLYQPVFILSTFYHERFFGVGIIAFRFSGDF